MIITALSVLTLNTYAQTTTTTTTTPVTPTAEETLKTNLDLMDTTQNVNKVMQASAGFDLATKKFATEPMTHYYAAYSKAILSYYLPENDMKKKDMYLDQADQYFEKYKSLTKESDETFVLAALLANARMAVDGQKRWKEYGKIFDENLEKAKALNADNPRIYYLRGTSTFWTPKMFGGGKKNAKPYFESAKKLFDKQDNSSVLKPIWGVSQTEWYLKQCEE